MNDDLLKDSVEETIGKRRMNMIRFRASTLLAIYFFIQTWYAIQSRSWGNMAFDLILALCLTACWFNKPIQIGPVEFGGW
jgi:hypothetical protein